MRRNGGRLLLTLANVITVGASLAADWNESHVFNRRWPGHARFHEVTALAMACGLSAFAIWRLWTPSPDPGAGQMTAAAVPIAYWGPFFLATRIPGATVDDPPHPVGRLGGVPLNILGAAATCATAVGGW